MLLDQFLEHFDLRDPQELIPTIYSADFAPADIARLAGVVFLASDDRDPVAARIVADASVQLAQTVTALTRQLEFDDRPIPLALTGGVLLNQPTFRRQVCHHLLASGFNLGATTTVQNPVAGGLVLASRALLR